MDDEIFCEIMKRPSKEELTEDDFLYIEEERKIREQVERFERGIHEVAWKDGREEGRKSRGTGGLSPKMQKCAFGESYLLAEPVQKKIDRWFSI